MKCTQKSMEYKIKKQKTTNSTKLKTNMIKIQLQRTMWHKYFSFFLFKNIRNIDFGVLNNS